MNNNLSIVNCAHPNNMTTVLIEVLVLVTIAVTAVHLHVDRGDTQKQEDQVVQEHGSLYFISV